MVYPCHHLMVSHCPSTCAQAAYSGGRSRITALELCGWPHWDKLSIIKKTGVVIQNSQEMTVTAFFHCKIAFEVHLPQLVGPLHLKSLVGFVFECFFWIYLIVASQVRSNGAGTGELLMSFALQVSFDFTPTPGGMRFSHLQHQFFDLSLSSCWAVL